MSIWEILRGEKPLFRSTRLKEYHNEIDTEFATLINTPVTHNFQFTPQPSGEVAAAAAAASASPPDFVSARYSLFPDKRIKILDTKGTKWDVLITVPQVGAVCYITHDPVRVLATSSKTREGTPLTNNPDVSGRPSANKIKWVGEMWASCDPAVPNTYIDVEGG